MSPDELKLALPRGLLSFTLTDFDAGGSFDSRASARRLEWLLRYPAAACFSAGGAGEFFSLTADEYANVLRVAVQTCGKRLPVLGAAGYGTRTAIEFHKAVHESDDATVARLMQDFVEPYIAIRKKQPGYAVSIVKAGAAIVGRGAGPVRAPLTDLTETERSELAALIGRLGPQE